MIFKTMSVEFLFYRREVVPASLFCAAPTQARTKHARSEIKSMERYNGNMHVLNTPRLYRCAARVLRLPESADTSKVTAKYENGTLHLDVLKVRHRASKLVTFSNIPSLCCFTHNQVCTCTLVNCHSIGVTHSCLRLPLVCAIAAVCVQRMLSRRFGG